MTATVRDNPDQERFEVHVDDALAGLAAYRRRDERIIFTHTEVDDAYEGQGLGSKLAAGALDAARDAGLAVFPECPFIADYIKRHREYVDLVPEDRRATYDL